jgi:hypothetical protein
MGDATRLVMGLPWRHQISQSFGVFVVLASAGFAEPPESGTTSNS